MDERPRVLTASWTLGTLFSLIIVLFIYLYARDHSQGHFWWGVLAFGAGAYLAISVILLVLLVLIPLIAVIIALLITWRQRGGTRRRKRRKNGFIDVEYEIKKP